MTAVSPSPFSPSPQRVREIDGISPDSIPLAELIGEQRPAILKGAARHWPLVQAGLRGPRAAMDYLKPFWSGHPVVGYIGRPESRGRFFYDESLTALDFEAGRFAFDAFLDRIAQHFADPQPPAFYIGSTDLDTYLPGLGAGNGLKPEIFGTTPTASIWIGNHTLAAAHFDMSNNIACSLVGRRRFTLFPPEQIENLYPGPLEPTPGGQVVSLVDFRDPDFDRYPRARVALAAAEIAELEPGDLLFYPALWWHQVEATEPFNVMINYWWNQAEPFMDTPWNTLLHALLSLRDRPAPEKQAWRALFDYYIFGAPDRAGAHLPEAARGPLGSLDSTKARRLRAYLLSRLNR